MWRYTIKIYIDNDPEYTYETAGNEYKLAEQIAVEVDGEKWAVDTSSIWDEYSCAQAYSREYVITESETKKFGAVLYDVDLESEESFKPVYVCLDCSENISPSELNAEFVQGNASAFEINLIKTGGMLQKDGAYQNILYVKPVSNLASGTYTATLKLSYDNDEDGTYEIDLGTCKVTYTAKNVSISVNPTSLDFGTLKKDFNGSEEVKKVVTVTNTGKVAVTLKNENPTANGPFGAVWFDQAIQIEPGESKNITLRTASNSPFAGIIGTYNGTYVITATSTIDSSDKATAEVTAKVIIEKANVYENQFTDVQEGKWYYDSVKYVYENGIMTGLNETTFGPSNNLTRGMMVMLLYKMEGQPEVEGTPTFPDVQDSGKYYYKAVKWASDNNIVTGYANGNFGPTDNITRAQLAVILYRFAQFKGKDVSKTSDLSEFPDNSQVASWAQDAVKWAIAEGIITGNVNKQTGVKTIDPKQNATRAQVATMIERYCKNIGR